MGSSAPSGVEVRRRDVPAGEPGLEAAAAEHREAPPLGTGRAVPEDRNALVGDAAPHAPGRRHGVGHVEAAEGDEGEHVQGPYPGVHAPVLPEVDVLEGEAGRRQRRPLHRRRVAHEGDDRPVVVGVGGPVQDVGALPAHLLHQGADEIEIPSLAEVRDRLQDRDHGGRVAGAPGPRHRSRPPGRYRTPTAVGASSGFPGWSW